MSFKNFSVFFLCNIIFFMLFPETASSEIISPPKLIINFTHQKSDVFKKVLTKDQVNSWKEGCNYLGNALTEKKGPLGFGVFSEFSCYIDNQNINGKPITTEYKLIVDANNNNISFAIYYNKVTEGKNVPQKMADILIPPADNFVKGLRDSGYMALIAYGLLDQLPFLGVIDIYNSKLPKEFFGILKGKFNLYPPKNLVFYDLARDNKTGRYSSKIYGTAIFESSKTIKPEKPLTPQDKDVIKQKNIKKQPTKKTIPTVKVTWKITPKDDLKINTKKIWFRSSDNLGANKKQIQAMILTVSKEIFGSGILEKFKTSIIASFASGYIGFRFAYPIGKSDDPFIGKAYKLGLFAEIRGGPLAGLRFYYNYIPKQKEVYNSKECTFYSSRFLLGWSFGWNLDKWWLSKIDIIPKISLWTVRVDLPTTLVYADNSQDVQVFEFSLKSAYSVSAELGTEWYWKSLLLRLWTTPSFAFGIMDKVKGNSNGSILVLSYGSDLWIKGPKVSNVLDLAFLIYNFFEKVDLSKEFSTPEDKSIKKISYSQYYLGAGLSVTW